MYTGIKETKIIEELKPNMTYHNSLDLIIRRKPEIGRKILLELNKTLKGIIIIKLKFDKVDYYINTWTIIN